MRLLCFLVCLALGFPASAAEYQPLERVISSAHDWSRASLEFSRYRWEQQSQQVVDDIRGALVEFDAITVYAPDIEVINDVAILSTHLPLTPVEGRSFSAYDETCRFSNTEVTVEDHLKSTALMLSGRTAITGRGSIKSIDFSNCTTSVTVALHTWNEARVPSTARSEPPPAMTRDLPSSNKALAVVPAPRPQPVVTPTPAVRITNTDMTTVSGSFSPAKMQDELSLEFPREPAGDLKVSVKCEATVTRKGNAKKLRCWGDRTNPFVDSIQSALEDMNFVPALVDGKSSEVIVPISVRFSRDGGTQQIEIFENHDLRANYTAPQRYKTGTTGTCGTGALWQTLTVNEEGRVQSVDIEPASASRHCVERIARKRLEDRYIPAMDDGTAVSSTLVAIFESR